MNCIEFGSFLRQWLLCKGTYEPSINPFSYREKIKIFSVSLSHILCNFFLREKLSFNCQVALFAICRLLQLIGNIVIVAIFGGMIHLLNPDIYDFFEPVFWIGELINQSVEIVVLLSKNILTKRVVLQELLPDQQLVVIFLFLKNGLVFGFLRDGLDMRFLDQRIFQIFYVLVQDCRLIVYHWSLKNRIVHILLLDLRLRALDNQWSSSTVPVSVQMRLSTLNRGILEFVPFCSF